MEETVKIKLGVTISLSRDSSEEGDIHGEAVVNYLTVTRTPIRKKKKKKTKHRRKVMHMHIHTWHKMTGISM